MTRPPIGSRVRLVHDVERYPHFIAPAGAEGDVVYHGDPNIYAVRLDVTVAGAETWSNEVLWQLDAGEEPADDVAIVADYVDRDWLAGADVDELRSVVAEGGPAGLVYAVQAELDSRVDPRELVAGFAIADEHAAYRESVRRTFAAMSDQALVVQDGVVVGGIDREELDAEFARRRQERLTSSTAAAYERASADVVLPLTVADAQLVADALELLADLDEGEHVDDEGLRRVAGVVRSHLADPVDVVQAELEKVPAGSWLLEPNARALVLVEAADRALTAGAAGYIGSVPEGRRFLADCLADELPPLIAGADVADRRKLATWLVEGLTAE